MSDLLWIEMRLPESSIAAGTRNSSELWSPFRAWSKGEQTSIWNWTLTSDEFGDYFEPWSLEALFGGLVWCLGRSMPMILADIC